MPARPAKACHFARQFGRTCGDFSLVNDAGGDHFLVPVDHDIPHQTLLWWLHYKARKMVHPLRTTSVHLYDSDEPDPATVGHLTEFCAKMSSPLILRKVPTVADEPAYRRLLVEVAAAQQCNKVALPDTLDAINAATLTNMALEGVYDGPAISQTVQLAPEAPEVRVVRPFALVRDAHMAAFAAEHEFTEAPTGVRIKERPYVARARRAFEILVGVNPGTNAEMNFFKSQFHIDRKLLGIGERQTDTES
jgi:hypothetical protein